MSSIPLDLRADHWELFDLLGVSVDVGILESVVSSNVYSRVAICQSERESVLVEVI